jgi:Tfp pilus assembly protein PilF
MPLAKDSVKSRLYLGDLFYERGSLARAEAEYRRALVLNPGSGEARRKLSRLKSIEKEAAAAGSVPPQIQESFTK